ncbi:hypothetical protein HZS_2740 [Henneguya salminicola]|nr:hypothetical protein HZS_2740 [Henneguya salminicola]
MHANNEINLDLLLKSLKEDVLGWVMQNLTLVLDEEPLFDHSEHVFHKLCSKLLEFFQTNSYPVNGEIFKTFYEFTQLFDSRLFEYSEIPVCCSNSFNSPAQKLWIHKTIHTPYLLSHTILTRSSFYWWNISQLISLNYLLGSDEIIQHLMLIHCSLSRVIDLINNFNLTLDWNVERSPLLFVRDVLENYNDLSNSKQFFKLITELSCQYNFCVDTLLFDFFQTLPNPFELESTEYSLYEQKLILFIDNISDENILIKSNVILFEWVLLPLSPYIQDYVSQCLKDYYSYPELRVTCQMLLLKTKFDLIGMGSDLAIAFSLSDPSRTQRIIKKYVNSYLNKNDKNIRELFSDIKLILTIDADLSIHQSYFIFTKEILLYDCDISPNLLISVFETLKNELNIFSVIYNLIKWIQKTLERDPKAEYMFGAATTIFNHFYHIFLNAILKSELVCAFESLKTYYRKRKSIQINSLIIKHDDPHNCFHAFKNPNFCPIILKSFSDCQLSSIVQKLFYYMQLETRNQITIHQEELRLILLNIETLFKYKIQEKDSNLSFYLKFHRIFGLFLRIFDAITDRACVYQTASFSTSWSSEVQFTLLDSFNKIINFSLREDDNIVDYIDNICQKLVSDGYQYSSFFLSFLYCDNNQYISLIPKYCSELLLSFSNQTILNNKTLITSLCSVFSEKSVKNIFEIICKKNHPSTLYNVTITGLYMSYFLKNTELYEFNTSLHRVSFWYSWISYWMKEDIQFLDSYSQQNDAVKYLATASKIGIMFGPILFDHTLLNSYAISFNLDITLVLKIYLYGIISIFSFNQTFVSPPSIFAHVLNWMVVKAPESPQFISLLLDLFFSTPVYCYEFLILISETLVKLNADLSNKKHKIIYILYEKRNQLYQFLIHYVKNYPSSSFEETIFYEQVDKIKSALSFSTHSSQLDCNNFIKDSFVLLSKTRLPLTLLIGKTWEVLQEELDCVNYHNLVPLIDILELNFDHFLFTAIVSSIKNIKISNSTAEDLSHNYSHNLTSYITTYKAFWYLLQGLINNIIDANLAIRAATEIGQYFSFKKFNKLNINKEASECLSSVFEWTHKKIKCIIKAQSRASEILSDSTNQTMDVKDFGMENLKRHYEDAILVWRVSKIEQILLDHGFVTTEFKKEIVDPNKLIHVLCNLIVRTKRQSNRFGGHWLYSLCKHISLVTSRINLQIIFKTLFHEWIMAKNEDFISVEKITNLIVSILEFNLIPLDNKQENNNQTQLQNAHFLLDLMISYNRPHFDSDSNNEKSLLISKKRVSLCLFVITNYLKQFYFELYKNHFEEFNTDVFYKSCIYFLHQFNARICNTQLPYHRLFDKDNSFFLPFLTKTSEPEFIFFLIYYFNDIQLKDPNIWIQFVSNIYPVNFPWIELKYFIKMCITCQLVILSK